MSTPETTADRQRVCEGCGTNYVWGGVEQDYNQAQDYAPPQRCKLCRQAQQAQQGREGKARNEHVRAKKRTTGRLRAVSGSTQG